MKITINNITYEQIPIPPVKKEGRLFVSIMMAAGALSYNNPYNNPPKQKPLPVVDVVKEFELIQLKQSKLPRAQRDMVVNYFLKHYRIVK